MVFLLLVCKEKNKPKQPENKIELVAAGILGSAVVLYCGQSKKSKDKIPKDNLQKRKEETNNLLQEIKKTDVEYIIKNNIKYSAPELNTDQNLIDFIQKQNFINQHSSKSLEFLDENNTKVAHLIENVTNNQQEILKLVEELNQKVQVIEESQDDNNTKTKQYFSQSQIVLDDFKNAIQLNDKNIQSNKKTLQKHSENMKILENQLQQLNIQQFNITQTFNPKEAFDVLGKEQNNNQILELIKSVPATFPIQDLKFFVNNSENNRKIIFAANGPGCGKSTLASVIKFLALSEGMTVNIIKSSMIKSEKNKERIDDEKMTMILNSISNNQTSHNSTNFILLIIDDEDSFLLEDMNEQVSYNINYIKGITSSSLNLLALTNHPEKMLTFQADSAIRSRKHNTSSQDIFVESSKKYLLFLMYLRKLYSTLLEEKSLKGTRKDLHRTFIKTLGNSILEIRKDLSIISHSSGAKFNINYRQMRNIVNDAYAKSSSNKFAYIKSQLDSEVKEKLTFLKNKIKNLKDEKGNILYSDNDAIRIIDCYIESFAIMNIKFIYTDEIKKLPAQHKNFLEKLKKIIIISEENKKSGKYEEDKISKISLDNESDTEIEIDNVTVSPKYKNNRFSNHNRSQSLQGAFNLGEKRDLSPEEKTMKIKDLYISTLEKRPVSFYLASDDFQSLSDLKLQQILQIFAEYENMFVISNFNNINNTSTVTKYFFDFFASALTVIISKYSLVKEYNLNNSYSPSISERIIIEICKAIDNEFLEECKKMQEFKEIKEEEQLKNLNLESIKKNLEWLKTNFSIEDNNSKNISILLKQLFEIS